jgi:hypothetical protein
LFPPAFAAAMASAEDFDNELKATTEGSDREKTYELPDDNIITVDSVRPRCPEVLPNLSFIGKEASGIHDTTFQSVIKYDVGIRCC